MQINLEWFRTFKAIYETGTLSAAAKELYVSQPGVSLHLNSLEAFTGYKLFDRSARRMVPTEKGKILYNFILDPIRKLETAEQHFHKRSQSERVTISVGMCFETFQYTLEEHIPSLPFNLIISFGEYREMLDQLDKGILDLIITPKKGISPNIEHEAFSSEQIILVGGKDVDKEQFENILNDKGIEHAEEWLKNEKWYGTAGDMEHLFQFWILNFGHKPNFRPNYIVPNLNSIVRCLKGGSGLAVVPDFLCKKEIENGEIQLIWEGKKQLKNTYSNH